MRSKGRRHVSARLGLVAIAGSTLIGMGACDSEPQIDPQQERNIRPGQRPEGSPRDEEN